ncbi:hypothetical protein HY085_01380 [Candidatus Gottesmanbacteria bacterium]|nr:hypothetical protein [Candidatus Gottesmanbacteria bacterium]
MKYLITYDLKNKTKNYTTLYEQIKSFGPWWHYLETVWIVKSTQTADFLSRDLLSHIDQSIDYILVIEIKTENKQGWLPQKAWDWLNEN